MEKHFVKNIIVLKKAILERKLVVFAGAGVSVDAGIPFWGTLIKELQKEIDVPESEHDYLKLAQMYFNERNQKEFLDKVREVLKHKKTRYNEIHEAILELNPEHIITTNFDDLFEQVIKAKAHPFSVVKKDSEFPYANNTKLLVKAHGDLDEGNLVLKEDDFLEYAKNHPLIENFIKGIFSNKVVLFIGYSFSDINLKIILQSVRNVLGVDFQNAYLLSVDDEVHHAQRQYLKQKGITVINYNDAGKVHDVNAIEQYLYHGHNAVAKNFEEKPGTLSEKGTRLYTLIKFVVKYADLKEAIAEQDPVNQMFQSLYRFLDIKSLPPEFLSNLYPFNKWDAYIHNYYEHTLSSNNKVITDFFFEDFDPAGFSIKASYFQKHGIHQEQVADLTDKLHFVLQKLNAAGIASFGRPEAKLHTFEYPQDMPHKVNVLLKAKACNCLSCLHNDLKLKEFLEGIKHKTISETTAIPDDLVLAYSNYKIGDFKTSYNQFEQIANKAWHLGKHISYYLAKRNVKYLRNMIQWRDEDFPSNHTRKIVEKIDDLDLDKLLFQIPNLDQDEYKLLKIIRDNDILLNAEKEINDVLDEIIKTDRLYKNGGTPSGSAHPALIYDELNKIFAFYNNNFIVKDEYTNYTRVIHKGIKALLVSYSISKKYKQGLQSFNFQMIRLMFLYGDEKVINGTLNEFKIGNIQIQEGSQNKVFSFLNNLLESTFTEVAFAGRHINLDRIVSAHAKSYFFQDKLRQLFHNALVIYSNIEVPTGYGKKIVRNFLDFLAVQDILVFFSGKYLVHFIHNIRSHFDFKEFTELMKTVVDSELDLSQTEFYWVVAKGLTENCPETPIQDKKLIASIIKKCIIPDQNRRDLSFMYLYKVSSEENKLIIAAAIRDSLAKKFNRDDFLDACMHGVLQLTEFEQQYVKELDDHVTIDQLSWEEDKPIRGGGHAFINWVRVIYSLNISLEKINYPQFKTYPDYYKFYLRPKAFDYNLFDPRWLILINVPYVHAKLVEIPMVAAGLKTYLEKEYNKKLAKIYAEYYLNKSAIPSES